MAGGVMNKGLQVKMIQTALNKMGISPDTVDVDALIDGTLHLYENMKVVGDFLNVDLHSEGMQDYIESGLEDQKENDREYVRAARERVKAQDLPNKDEAITLKFMEIQWKKVLPLPSVALITGKRGSGKSACGYWLLDFLSKEYKIPAYAIGLPPEKMNLLPPHIKALEISGIEDLPENAAIFIDEAGMLFYAREWKNDMHSLMDRLLSISRQKNQIVILATHTSRKLDVAIVMDCDAVIIKEPSLLHAKFERHEVRAITEEALEKFSVVPEAERKTKAYVYAHSTQGEMLENGLPDFWTEDLSKAFAGISVTKTEKVKKGDLKDLDLNREVEASRKRQEDLKKMMEGPAVPPKPPESQKLTISRDNGLEPSSENAICEPKILDETTHSFGTWVSEAFEMIFAPLELNLFNGYWFNRWNSMANSSNGQKV